MKRRKHLVVAAVGALALLGCRPPSSYEAKVELSIDGNQFDYSTQRAQFDRLPTDGRYSVYLLPPKPDGKAPYLNLRAYMGNPVTHVWIRYNKPGVQADELHKYECFVPGVLYDGRPTLGWTKANGEKREPSETGTTECRATVEKLDSGLQLRFEARLCRKEPEKKVRTQEKKTDECSDTVVAKGKAVLQFGRS